MDEKKQTALLSNEERKALRANLTEYDEVQRAATAEYEKTMEAAYARYDEIKSAAGAQYEQAQKTAWATYMEGQGSLGVRYRDLLATGQDPAGERAWDEYTADRQSLWSAYQHTTNAVQAQYKKVVDAAQAEYDKVEVSGNDQNRGALEAAFSKMSDGSGPVVDWIIENCHGWLPLAREVLEILSQGADLAGLNDAVSFRYCPVWIRFRNRAVRELNLRHVELRP